MTTPLSIQRTHDALDNGEQRCTGIRAFLIGMAMLSLAGCGEGPTRSPIDTGNEPIFHQADLNALESWMGLDQSWPPGARDEANTKLAELRSLESLLSPIPLWLAAAEIVALADNAHSNISRLAVYNSWRILPIRAFWFTDGLFVVRASPANVDLLVARS